MRRLAELYFPVVTVLSNPDVIIQLITSILEVMDPFELACVLFHRDSGATFICSGTTGNKGDPALRNVAQNMQHALLDRLICHFGL